MDKINKIIYFVFLNQSKCLNVYEIWKLVTIIICIYFVICRVMAESLEEVEELLLNVEESEKFENENEQSERKDETNRGI